MIARKLLVAGIILFLALFFTATANAQSVQGSGESKFGAPGVSYTYQVTVDAFTRNNGQAAGKIDLTLKIKVLGGAATPGNGSRTQTIKETYKIEALSVTNNVATLWARAKSDNTLHEFLFVDNGNGSGEPDYFVLSPSSVGLRLSFIPGGDIRVLP